MRVCLRRRGGIADSANLLGETRGRGGIVRMDENEVWGLHTWHELKQA